MEDVRERDKLITNYLGHIRSLCGGERFSIHAIGGMLHKLLIDIMDDELRYPEEMHERLTHGSDDDEYRNVIEELADLEHRQWMHWSKYLAENHDIPEGLEEKWEENWRPYEELSDELKEKDRKWARKALKIAGLHHKSAEGDIGE